MSKLGITSKDLSTLTNIFDEELKKAGVTPDQIPLIGTRGTILQSTEHLFETVASVIENNNLNSSIMTTQSKAQLMSALTQRLYKTAFSKPSQITLYVEIPINDIIKFGKSITPNTWEFEFKDENIVILDEIIFMPEKSKYYIRVTKKQHKYSVRAFYLNELNVAVNIPIQKLKIERVSESVILTMNFIQVDKKIINKTFQDSELDYFIITTKDLLYDFKIEHSKHLSGPYTPLEAVTVLTRGNDNALKYEYRNEYSIGLEYKYIHGFKANKGDTLRITTFSTTGRNINFRGQPQVKNKIPKDLHINYISSEYDGTYKSYGGLNNASQIDSLRDTIITANGTRFKIDTEQDMLTYLNQYQGISKFKAKLAIQDIEHVFSIFTLLRFDQKISTGEHQTFVIPTNTGTTQVDLKTLPKKTIEGYNYYAVRSDMPIKSTQSNTKEIFDLIQKYDGDNSPELDKTLFYYVSPFLYSIREIDGMVRCYSDTQYNEKYPTTAIYESEDDENITMRFINTSLRVNDYIDENSNKRVFNILAQIRCDENDIELTKDNFLAKLQLKDVDDNEFSLIGKVLKSDDNNSTYDIIFDLESDRNIFDTRTIISYQTIDKQQNSKEVFVKQDMTLELYLKPKLQKTLTLVSKYQSNVEIFKDNTVLLYTQSNMLYSGVFELVELPLISYEFYQIPHNQQTINKELTNISNFLVSSIYKPTKYEIDSKSLNDLLPTTYRIRIKFVKTYGLSKFLAVGNISVTELQNLQISPKFYISKINPDYDMSIISSILNDTFTTWDFNSQDLHMSILTAGILTNVEDDLSSLQFVNFSNYPSDYHTMKSNGKRERYNDIPEIVSIKPKYNEDLKIYSHDCTYIELV